MSDKHKEVAGKNEEGKSMDRRKFIKNSGLVAGGLVGGTMFGGVFSGLFSKDDKKEDSAPTDNYEEARMFFERKKDFTVLIAAVERIYPESEAGPGAVELGVPYFIDRELAGTYGINAKEYMQAPFKDVENEERYQSRLNRGDIFLSGIRSLEAVSRKDFDEAFEALDGEKQDKVLTKFEAGDAKMKGVSASYFFSLLRRMTIEGVYADPLYGGNKNMAGWKMREYPGPRPAYIDDIESKEFVQMDPISLKDYQP